MPRRLLLPLLALLCPLIVTAAPVPKETPAEMVRRVYGEVGDPKSKLKCEPFGKDGLRVTVPEGPSIRDNAAGVIPPLIVREMTGDFAVTVRVAQRTDKAGVGKESQSPYLAAGVSACGGDGRTTVRVVAQFIKDGDGWKPEVELHAATCAGGVTTGLASKFDPGKPVYLRLTRRGESFAGEASGDGETWVKINTYETKGVSDAATVGPIVYPNVDGEYVAEFDRYELRPLPAATDGRK